MNEITKTKNATFSIICILSLVLIFALCFTGSIFASEETSVATSGTVVNGTQTYTWTFDDTTDTLTLEVTAGRAWGEQITLKVSQDTDYIAFANTYGESVKTITVVNVCKLRGSFKLLNCPNTETIILENCDNRWDNDSIKVFGGMPNLKVLRLTGSDSSVNYIDLTKVGTIGNNKNQYTYMFENCTFIKKVVLNSTNPFKIGNGASENEKLYLIPEGTFSGCTSLSDITLPDWVQTIESKAFAGCTALEQINIPASVTSIASDAFTGAGIKKVVYGGTKDNISVITNCFDTSVVIDAKNADAAKALVDAGYTVTDPLAALTVSGNFTYKTVGTYSWEFVGTARTLTVTLTAAGSDYRECHIEGLIAQDDFQTFANEYGTYVDKLVISGIRKFSGGIGIIDPYCPNITTVEFVGANRLDSSKTFSGMKNLKTLILSGSENSDCIDLTKIGNVGWAYGSFKYTFENCTSIEKVILNASTPFMYDQLSLNPGEHIPEGFFYGCTSLSKITIPEWVKTIEAKAFYGCTSLNQINITGSVTSIASDAFEGASVKKIIFTGTKDNVSVITNNFGTNLTIYTEDTESTEILRNAGYTVYGILASIEASGEYTFDERNYTWEFDGKTQTLTATYVSGAEWRERTVEGLINSADFQSFASNYGKYVKTLTLVGHRKISKVGIISDYCPNIETVILSGDDRIVWSDNMFDGMKSLKKVILSNGKDVGYSDLSTMSTWGWNEGDVTNFFKNCTSIKKVEISSDTPFKFEDGTTTGTFLPKGFFDGCTSLASFTIPNWVVDIHDNVFNNCISIKEIALPSSIASIGASAFGGCTALNSVVVNCDTAPTLAAGSFTGCSGITFYCKSTEVADAINAQLETAGCTGSVAIAFSKGNMTADGFSVRYAGYNGLRMHFVFNETLNSGNGYNLVEYGTICATAENYTKYTETFGETDSLIKNDFTSPDKIVKVVVYNKDTGYNPKVDASNKEKVEFTVTITNFEESQYTAEMKSAGYEIWEKDGTYYVIYTSYPNPDYNTISLFKVTLGMLTAYPEYLTIGENPIWNVLNAVEHTNIETDNQNITAMLFDDPITEGKKIAVYATASNETIDLVERGLTKEEKKLVFAYIYGKNISYTIPELNNVWREYMEYKMDEVPEGKSFIFYTDTHSGHDWYSSTLIEYARKKLGINTVIFGGDPYDTGSTAEDALYKLKQFSLNQFFDVQKETGLYVLGNHDTNPITARDKGDEKYNYLISDTDMFEYTVGQSLKYGRNLVFDQKAIAAVENFTFEANCRFTAEEMKEQAIAAMKMHYYTDDDVNKIRYIILDTGGMGVTQFAEFSQLGYCDIIFTELGWLAETLGTVPNGYDVIVAGHMQNWDSVVAKSENGQTVSNEDGAFTEHVSKNLASIMSLYKQSAVGTYTVNFSDFNPWSTANGNIAAYAASADNTTFENGVLTINYDFSNHTTGTIASFSGHCHVDRSYMSGFDVSTGEYKSYRCYGEGDEAYFDGGVLGILTTTDAVGYQTFKNIPPMTRGTTTGNAFDIVTITTDGRLVCTRIGAGENRIYNYN